MGRRIWIVGIFVMLASTAGAEEGVAARIAVIDLGGPIEESFDDPFAGLLGEAPETLGDLQDRLAEAAGDETLRACVLRIRTPLSGAFSTLSDLREAVVRLREAGKPVHAYLEDGSLGTYLVASACETVTLAPETDLWVCGLSSEMMHFRDLLDWLGIGFEVENSGPYKGAGEPFTEREATPAYRESIQALLEDLYGQVAEAVAQGRHLDVGDTRTRLGDGPYSSEDAMKASLADAVGYEDAFWRTLKETLGGTLAIEEEYAMPEDERSDLSSLAGCMAFMTRVMAPPEALAPGTDRIVVVRMSGPIVSEAGEDPFGAGGAITPGDFLPILRELRADDSVKAVVIRIDSPGGGILPSDLIWHELERLSEKKPVVASMGAVAASGGYYLAAGCDAIVAHPATITGSIGVIVMRPNLAALYDKAGIGVTHVEVGGHSAWFRSDEAMSDAERAYWQRLVGRAYEGFLGKVCAARGATRDEIHVHAQGRVWTGRQAIERGLVDRLGGLDDAIDLACERAGIPPDQEIPVETLPAPRTLADLLSGVEGHAGGGPWQMLPYEAQRALRDASRVCRERGALAWLPAAPSLR